MPWMSQPLAPRLANLSLDSSTQSLWKNLAELKVTLAPSTQYNFTQMDEVMPVVERMVMFVFTSLMKLTLTLNLISKQQIQFQLQLRNICDSIIVPVFTLKCVKV